MGVELRIRGGGCSLRLPIGGATSPSPSVASFGLRLLPLSPPHPEAAIDQFLGEHAREGEMPMAIEAFKLNVERFPESANAYHSLGRAYCWAGELDLALENYERAYRMTDGTQHPSAATYRARYEQLSREGAAGC